MLIPCSCFLHINVKSVFGCQSQGRPLCQTCSNMLNEHLAQNVTPSSAAVKASAVIGGPRRTMTVLFILRLPMGGEGECFLYLPRQCKENAEMRTPEANVISPSPSVGRRRQSSTILVLKLLTNEPIMLKQKFPLSIDIIQSVVN